MATKTTIQIPIMLLCIFIQSYECATDCKILFITSMEEPSIVESGGEDDFTKSLEGVNENDVWMEHIYENIAIVNPPCHFRNVTFNNLFNGFNKRQKYRHFHKCPSIDPSTGNSLFMMTWKNHHYRIWVPDLIEDFSYRGTVRYRPNFDKDIKSKYKYLAQYYKLILYVAYMDPFSYEQEVNTFNITLYSEPFTINDYNLESNNTLPKDIISYCSITTDTTRPEYVGWCHCNIYNHVNYC